MKEIVMENKHLKYLQDLPRFDENWGGKVPDDKFKHQGYVDALHNLVKECPTPFCLGLFGGWGSGKTGIVLELCNTLKQKNKDIKHLYFDVWKYSADSLRRQLLIKIDEEWFDKKLDFENKLYID